MDGLEHLQYAVCHLAEITQFPNTLMLFYWCSELIINKTTIKLYFPNSFCQWLRDQLTKH